MAKRGRPSDYTEELATVICDRMEEAKEKMRYAARAAPHLFGKWADLK